MSARTLKRSDITDRMVVEAYVERDRLQLAGEEDAPFPYELLVRDTGAPEKVVYAACERAFDRGFLEYGVSLRTGWVEEKGYDLLGDEAEAARKIHKAVMTKWRGETMTAVGRKATALRHYYTPEMRRTIPPWPFGPLAVVRD